MFGWKKEKKNGAPVRQETAAIRNRFTEAVKRIQHLEYYEAADDDGAPLGYFDGRPIVGSRPPINGGVFIGAQAHEAVVVDESYGELERIYSSLTVEFARNEHGKESLNEKIFPYVVRIVQQTLEFRPEAVRELERSGQLQADRKIALDFFIRKGFGATRHQVLLAAYLLEKLVRRGLLEGDISIDEKMLFEHDTSEKLEFISYGGHRFIFDPLNLRDRVSHHISESLRGLNGNTALAPTKLYDSP